MLVLLCAPGTTVQHQVIDVTVGERGVSRNEAEVEG